MNFNMKTHPATIGMAAKTWLAFAILASGLIPAQSASYYVATNGNDSANGSLTTPFQTIQQAASVMVAGDTCYIRAGIYRETVTPVNSGNSSSQITFTNYNNETVVVSGLDVVTNIWTLDSGSIYRCTNFMGLGGSNQVFASGAMVSEARWPNNTGTYTYFTTDHPASSGTKSANGLTNYFTDNNFPFTNSADLNGAKIWIAPGWQYQSYVMTVRSYDPVTKIVGYDSVDTGTGWVPFSYSPFYLFGCKSMLNTNNEWWYDASNQVVYLWAPSNANPNALTVELKARDLGFGLDGLGNITIGGLQLKGCRISAKLSNGIILRGLNCQYILNNCSTSGNGEGIYLRGNNCEVSGCEIAYSSAALLNVELSGSCKVFNNFLHDGCSVRASRALKVMGSSNIVSHNTIRDTGGNLIRLDMQAGVFQYNVVYNGAWYLRDCGLMYNNYIDGKNTVIQFNVFHDNLSGSTNQSHAMYFDSGTSDFIIVRNIIYNNKMNGLKFNTGYHDLIYNNTLVNSSRYAIQYQDVSSTKNAPTDRVDWPELANNIVTCNNITSNSPPQLERNPYSSGNLDPTVIDPAYVNANANDFNLTAGSPARDKGVFIAGVTTNYQGLFPDIGAIEYGTSFPKVGHDFSNPPPTNLLILPDVTIYTHRNLVGNGSFETAYSSGIPGWTLGDAQTLFITNQNSSAGDKVFNGYNSARFGPSVDSAQQTIANLIPGMRYVATAWAKADEGETAQFNVSGFGSGVLSVSGSATNWQPLDIWFTNGVANTTTTLQVKKTSQNGQYVYMDLCALKQSPSPLLLIQPDLTLQGNPLITVTNAARYSAPGASVAYSLINAPAGATIDTNGVIHWQPDLGQIPGTNLFITVAQDPAFPTLAASNLFTVTLKNPAHAMVYEGFVAGTNNANGQYVANPGTDTSGRYKFIAGQNPAVTGFVGSWIGLTSAQYELGTTPTNSLVYPGVGNTGNSAFRQSTVGGSARQLDVTNTFANYNDGTGQIGRDGTTLYFSFLMKLDSPTNQGSLGFSSTTNSNAEVQILANGTNYVFSANGTSSATVVATDTNTHLFAIKFQFGATDTVSYWMDPADLATEANNPPTTTLSINNPGSVNYSYLTMLRGSSGGTVGRGVVFDELRFAGSWGNNLFISTNTLPTTPTTLTWTNSPTSLQLQWPANYTGWVLQCQTNSLTQGLGANWVDVAGSQLTNQWSVQIQSTNPAMFFRLRAP
ncbi:MAG: right-handed parallel beta-helix repeat-containing protein [Verrucomicrobiota bacterium]